MSKHSGNTDKLEKVKLESSIEQVMWTRTTAAPKGKVGIDVFTQFVGNNSEISIKISDKSGKTFETIKAKMSGNHFWKQITVPEKAKEELYAEVKLPKHSLSKKSNGLYLFPLVEIKNLKWDKQEARRGDILKLTADIKGLADGNEAEIQIWEHDSDEAHDLITKFPALVKNRKVEAEWEFEYHEDTDDIPTEEESENGYNPPEYFFRINIGGVSADSGLLEFKDWIEIELEEEDGSPIAKEEYVIKLPNGEERKGKLDQDGYCKEEDIPPGRIQIEFPNLNKALQNN